MKNIYLLAGTLQLCPFQSLVQLHVTPLVIEKEQVAPFMQGLPTEHVLTDFKTILLKKSSTHFVSFTVILSFMWRFSDVTLHHRFRIRYSHLFHNIFP